MVGSSPPITLKGEPHHTVKSSRPGDSLPPGASRSVREPLDSYGAHVRPFPWQSCQRAKNIEFRLVIITSTAVKVRFWHFGTGPGRGQGCLRLTSGITWIAAVDRI